MNATFFGLAFLAALNPKLLGADLLLMQSGRPRAMLACFLAGCMAVALAVGLLDVSVVHADAIKTQGSVSAGLDLALGVPLLAVGALVATAPHAFRMAMYHAGHPDGNYQMANRVQAFDPPRAISWEPGQDTGDGSLRFGGWVWAYDLAPAEPSGTRVTLSYDWSAVPASLRQHIGFPPVPSGSSGQLAGPPVQRAIVVRSAPGGGKDG
jgi:Sap, sulfolipid-1-addressing protein